MAAITMKTKSKIRHNTIAKTTFCIILLFFTANLFRFSKMKLMYKVIFANKTYLPYYHYYLASSKNKSIKSLGYLPTGIDTTYRKYHVSTIIMIQAITQLASNSRYDVIKNALLSNISEDPLRKHDLYSLQKKLTYHVIKTNIKE